MSFDLELDRRVRLATFSWLEHIASLYGDVLSLTALQRGFEFEGQRIHVVFSQQGIFKPRMLKLPTTIRSTFDSPYDDEFSDGHLLYRYRGTNPDHPDNRGLRSAMAAKVPLAYFHGLMAGRYLAVWPVFIVGDDPSALTFRVSVDAPSALAERIGAGDDRGMISEDMLEGRRMYATVVTKRRIHQRAFRERVLDAYRRQCSFCKFRHEELLDAAHIVPDSDPLGEASVRNGLALCRLHHAAFDRHFLGVRPDGIIQVRRDILDEEDGPTLKHAIQALHGLPIQAPRHRLLLPSQELLGLRYQRFLSPE